MLLLHCGVKSDELFVTRRYNVNRCNQIRYNRLDQGLLTCFNPLAAKRDGEIFYTVYDVVGWRSHRNQPVMRVTQDIPDRYWCGEKPRILKQHRGSGADRLIDEIDRAAREYPWKTTYKAFPGPNGNTFVAWIGKQVPELELDLLLSAIGSGYINKYP